MKQKLLSLIMLLTVGAILGPQMMAEKLLIGTKEFNTYSVHSDMSVEGKTSGTLNWEPGTKSLTFKNVVMEI